MIGLYPTSVDPLARISSVLHRVMSSRCAADVLRDMRSLLRSTWEDNGNKLHSGFYAMPAPSIDLQHLLRIKATLWV